MFSEFLSTEMALGITFRLPVIVFVTSFGLKCFEQTLGRTFLDTCMRLKDELRCLKVSAFNRKGFEQLLSRLCLWKSSVSLEKLDHTIKKRA